MNLDRAFHEEMIERQLSLQVELDLVIFTSQDLTTVDIATQRHEISARIVRNLRELIGAEPNDTLRS